jgi:MFS family permease
VQGLGAGAEYGGAVIFLVENAPPKHRGFWGSFAPLGVSVGNLLAAGAFALVTLLPREDLMSWGWRIPFLASFLLIMVGIYVRLRITETPVFTEAVVARGKVERNPAMEALKRHPRNFFVVLGARLAENGLGYLFPVFGLSYVITTLGVPRSDALSALMLAFVVELFTIVGFATLSDRIGRRPVYMFGALAGIAWAFPFGWSAPRVDLDRGRLHRARAVVTAAMFGPQAAYFAELFPPQRRLRISFRPRTGSLLLADRRGCCRGAGGVVGSCGRACYAALLAGLTALAIWSGRNPMRKHHRRQYVRRPTHATAAVPQHAA